MNEGRQARATGHPWLDGVCAPSVHRSSRSLEPGSRSIQAEGSRWVVYAWVDDDDTKRAYEISDDTYRVFRNMLQSGHPPDDWGGRRTSGWRKRPGSGASWKSGCATA